MNLEGKIFLWEFTFPLFVSNFSTFLNVFNISETFLTYFSTLSILS